MTKSARSLLFRVHGWIGVHLFLLLFVIMSTGTLAVVSNEIDWLLRAEMRAPATERPVSWQTLHDAVRRTFPENDIQQLNAPIQPGFSAEVQTLTPAGAVERVYVDPGTGRVLGSHGWITVQRFLRNLHMGLFLPEIGIYVVSAFGFFLLVSLITGLVTYKQFWRGLLKRPRTRNARTLTGDLHRLAGLWSLWLVLLISITGIWYFVEAAVDYRWEREAPAVPASPVALDERIQQITIAEVEAKAAQLWPGFRIDYITLPTNLDEPVTIGGHGAAWLVRSRGNLIYLHPVTGATLQIKDATRVPTIERWIDTADPLHFGNFAGLVSKAVWFLFGLALSFLSFSGFWLSLRRARRPSPAVPHPAGEPAFA
jgi:uncharacterized iron-regulated membrane protein